MDNTRISENAFFVPLGFEGYLLNIENDRGKFVHYQSNFLCKGRSITGASVVSSERNNKYWYNEFYIKIGRAPCIKSQSYLWPIYRSIITDRLTSYWTYFVFKNWSMPNIYLRYTSLLLTMSTFFFRAALINSHLTFYFIIPILWCLCYTTLLIKCFMSNRKLN